MPSLPDNDKNKDLLRYAGLTTQIFVSLGVAVFIGLKVDHWLKLSFPILAWLLPLLVLIGLIIRLIKETTRNRNKE